MVLVGLGDFEGFGEVAVGLAVVCVGVGALVVGAAVVGAWVVGATAVIDGDALDRVALGVGDGDGSGSSVLLRDAHNAPAPRPSAMATITAMMIGTFDGFGSCVGSSGSCAGGIAMVG